MGNLESSNSTEYSENQVVDGLVNLNIENGTTDICCIYFSETNTIDPKIDEIFLSIESRGFAVLKSNILDISDIRKLNSSLINLLFINAEILDYIWRNQIIIELIKLNTLVPIYYDKVVYSNVILKDITGYLDISNIQHNFMKEAMIVSRVLSNIKLPLSCRSIIESHDRLYQRSLEIVSIHRENNFKSLESFDSLMNFVSNVKG